MDSDQCGAEEAKGCISNARESGLETLDLQQLQLSDSDLNEILPMLPELGAHVRSLNLFLNDITHFPAGLAKALPRLCDIKFGANPLKSFDDAAFVGMNELEELDVGFSECLEKLPSSIGECQALRILYAGNGRLRDLPRDLFTCTALEELHLYGNELTDLPDAIGNLSKLRVLNVGRNQLQCLPLEITRCTGLERLYVYENDIASLPRGLNGLPALRLLNVENNARLPRVPHDIRRRADVREIASHSAT